MRPTTGIRRPERPSSIRDNNLVAPDVSPEPRAAMRRDVLRGAERPSPARDSHEAARNTVGDSELQRATVCGPHSPKPNDCVENEASEWVSGAIEARFRLCMTTPMIAAADHLA